LNNLESHLIYGLTIDNTFRIEEFKGIAKVLNGHTDFVRKVIKLNENNMIASCSDDAQIIIWQTDLRQPFLKKISGHLSSIYGIEKIS
jgi:WD40 repeat protein